MSESARRMFWEAMARGLEAERDELKAEVEEAWAKNGAGLRAWMREKGRAEKAEAMAGRLAEYVAHETTCILSFWEAGEPTEDGGYRTKYAGKWYQSKPINKEPKCNCGLDDLYAAYEQAKGEDK